MQRLLLVSSCSWLVSTGCSDDACGPGDAPELGIVASSSDTTLTYGGMVSGQNNDCTDRSVPDVVISLTLEATQVGSTTKKKIVFCVPHPDAFRRGVPFGDEFRVINFDGEAGGCTYELASGTQATGTARASGLCDDGANDAGYALTLDGSVTLLRTCPTSTDMIPFEVHGTTAVGPWGS
jgi:hypothetical protein